MAAYSEISKIANSNLRLGSLADRSSGANAGWFGKRFHKILGPRIDVILGVAEIVAHVRSFAGRGTLVDRSIFAYLHEWGYLHISVFVYVFVYVFVCIVVDVLCFRISIVYPPN